jgi:hypothetical protein
MLTRSFEDNVKTIFIKYLAPFLFIAKAITIDDLTGSWFDTLKQEVMNVKENLWLTVNSEPQNGILGLFNCLKQEPNGERLR